MGIEHPILGLITATIVLSILVGALVLMTLTARNIQEVILSTPVTEGFVSCFSESLVDSRYIYNISLVIANSGRVDLKLEKLFISTDLGIITLDITSGYTSTTLNIGGVNVNLEVVLAGFSKGNELWAGQRGEVRVNMVSTEKLYSTGGQYSITGYLKSMYVGPIASEAFTAREGRFRPGTLPECQKIVPPPPVTPSDIVLVSRSALYWDDFSKDPIDTRMLLVQEQSKDCRAGHVATGYGRSGLVYLEIQTEDRECALIVQGLTLPNTGTIYVAFTSLIAIARERETREREIDQPGLFGAILLSLDSRRDIKNYIENYYAGGFDEGNDKLVVRGKVGVNRFSNTRNYIVDFNKWYNGTLALSYAIPNVPLMLASYANTSVTVSYTLASNQHFTPSYAGLSINKPTPGRESIMRVYFDSILVTHNSPPWIVRVGKPTTWMDCFVKG